MTPQREIELLEAHRGGDPAALGDLLRSYQRRVYAICYRMLRDPEESADLTQDALIRVIEGLRTYDRRAALSTWVIRVTMNCCLSHLRKKRVRYHESLDEPAGAAGDPLVSLLAAERELPAAHRVEQDELRSMLLRGLEDLDPDMRAILVLRDLQGLDYREMGTVLDIPIGTVKSRLFRARAALRVAVERELRGDGGGDARGNAG